MKIFVKTISGQKVEIEVEPNDSVDVVMQKIQDLQGISIDQQKIVFQGKPVARNNVVRKIVKPKTKNFGLINKQTKGLIPLKELDIMVHIENNIAHVEYMQTYVNDSDTTIETEYFFPIPDDACFHSFEAQFNDILIQGKVKERTQAQEEYKQAVDAGKSTAMAVIEQSTSDIMKVLIANIPKDCEVKIKFSFYEKIELVMNKFWRFNIYSTITPRYNPKPTNEDEIKISNPKEISASSGLAYPWRINVKLESRNAINFLKSSSHDIITKYNDEKTVCNIALNPEKIFYPNRDFTLVYNDGTEKDGSYVLTPYDDGYVAHVTFAPQFDTISLQDSYDMLANNEGYDDSDAPDQEYVFVLDRSGSMQGQRIQLATQALVVFLKSLPANAKFNVVSFGTLFAMMHENSVSIFDEEKLEGTIKTITHMAADMGGTEILKPLSHIFTNLAGTKNLKVFLLTDGDVSNTDSVLKLIEDNNKWARVFTIGIGNGCSPQLIRQGAEKGNGDHIFIADDDDVSGKIVSLLAKSMAPCLKDIQFEGEEFKKLSQVILPNPESITKIYRDQPTSFFMLFDQDLEKIEEFNIDLLAIESSKLEKVKNSIRINTKNLTKNDAILKLGLRSLIKLCESYSKVKSGDDAYIAKAADFRMKIPELSVKYGILCNRTAFICESFALGADGERKKIDIPIIKSADYEKDDVKYESVGAKTLNDYNIQQGSTLHMILSLRGDGGGSSTSQPIEATPGPKKINPQLFEVIKMQNFVGYWEDKNENLKAILQKFMDISPGEIDLLKDLEEKADVVNTCIVLFWMENCMSDDKNTWIIIFRKAISWLKGKGIKYSEIKDTLLQIVKIK